MDIPVRLDRSAEASSRHVQRWLEHKIKESMRLSLKSMTAQLRAEQEERIQSGR